MSQLTRVLFVSGEVAPFANASDTAALVRKLPESLHGSGAYETRTMMPRYGTISERRNRLHEVIRLSGSTIRMGNRAETLRVKVASIPGIRLQVYFMDNVRFFKRKGLHRDKQGKLFPDNAERALFFGRSVVETIRKLQWKPDIVHAFGWISGLLPLLLTTEYSSEALFEDVKVIFTPDDIDPDATLSGALIKKMNLSMNGNAAGLGMNEIGLRYADATAFPPSLEADPEDAVQFSMEPTTMMQQAIDLYEAARSELTV